MNVAEAVRQLAQSVMSGDAILLTLSSTAFRALCAQSGIPESVRTSSITLKHGNVSVCVSEEP